MASIPIGGSLIERFGNLSTIVLSVSCELTVGADRALMSERVDGLARVHQIVTGVSFLITL